MKKTDHLFSDFKPVSKSEWLQKIEKDLKGKPLTDLQVELGDLKLDPFPHASDLAELSRPMNSVAGWEIGEEVEVGNDLNAANGQLIKALENGVNAPRLVLSRNLNEQELATLLNGVQASIVSLHFLLKNSEVDPLGLLSLLVKRTLEEGHSTEALKISVNQGRGAAVGKEQLSSWLGYAQKESLDCKLLTAYGREDYADDEVVDELARMIKQAADYLSLGAEAGFEPSVVSRHLQFSLQIGKNYFLQIARIRALNLLWANVLKSWNLEVATPPYIDAHLADNGLSEDPNMNMIAATTQAMSAIIGGASRLTLSSVRSDNFSRRIARNVQHILQMESYFDRVADPAAGSYFVESLTDKLAQTAWSRFQEMMD